MKRRYQQRRASHGGLRAIHLCTCLIAFLPCVTHAAGIVADGGTATTVVSAANGGQTVNIAPAVSGVSQNTYSSFNVGVAGATLNNVGINARTIVNQVTSSNPSLIEGQISVTGSRANVILANPNGITVNGGSFVNTGHVALTTGQVSFDDLQIAPGIFQRNVVLNTTGGAIVIGPQGLSSALVDLDLIAKTIQINGPVANTFTSATAITRAVAGTSAVTLNTGLSPSDNANDWLTLQTGQPLATANSFALDITAAGSVTSGRVEIIVTDKGPGVRSAGPLDASLGDFTLSSNGSVQISNTTVTANGNINFQVQDGISLTDTRVTSGTATLDASGAITLTGSSILTNGGATLSANGITLTPDSAQTGSTLASATAGVVLDSTADITNLGSLIQGQAATSGDAQSLGAVTLDASGNILNQSLPGTPLGILFGVKGDVVVSAGGNIVNQNARILSNENVTIAAGGDVDNIIDHTSGVDNGVASSYSSDGWSFLFLEHHSSGISVNYGELSDPTALSYITADAGNVTITGNNINNVGGSILSNDGAISITARNSLLDQGVFTGQAQFHESCFIFCHSSASSDVQLYGGDIEAGTSISLKAGTQILNTGGTVLAEGALTLNAPHVVAQGVLGYTAIDENHDLKAWFGSEWSAIYASDMGGLFDAGSGQVQIIGEGDIEGGAFSGPGGVSATGGIVTRSAPYRAPVTIGTHNSIGLISWFGL
ncbi:two-partner secretion domain-containing protein [Paraburkholderia xenovorans]|uniref:Filamentous hemagglutinin n=1 Tax=Paraburkholderia xenovorans (strain LB400) TaxID=266265 RepID=Q13JF2_PARXL|nr:filamentous hemagglutinin N-terminal domain-containing protein [Paraburkholderia xenovorans]ABE35787.1 Filamentous hemagglutinin [Paraburkholderia xenovorans LB400]